MATPEKIKVVHIRSGAVEEMYATPGFASLHLWRKLNKDGSRPGNRYSDGLLRDKPTLYTFARYDQEREVKANVIRAEIKDLQTRQRLAENELLHLYATEEEAPNA